MDKINNVESEFLSVYNLNMDDRTRSLILRNAPHDDIMRIRHVYESAMCLAPILTEGIIPSLAEMIVLYQVALDSLAEYTNEVLRSNSVLQEKYNTYQMSFKELNTVSSTNDTCQGEVLYSSNCEYTKHSYPNIQGCSRKHDYTQEDRCSLQRELVQDRPFLREKSIGGKAFLRDLVQDKPFLRERSIGGKSPRLLTIQEESTIGKLKTD